MVGCKYFPLSNISKRKNYPLHDVKCRVVLESTAQDLSRKIDRLKFSCELIQVLTLPK